MIGIRRSRLTQPLVRVDAVLWPAGWDEALALADSGLARARAQEATRSFGMFSFSNASNEVNHLVGRVHAARAVDGAGI